MELNWSTFVLEILNFLVLLWILQRFFYKPVLEAIARRRAGIEQSLSEAQATRSEADALKTQYESRLDEWEGEKGQARENLRLEFAAERERLLAALQLELGEEREKSRALEEKFQADCLRKFEATCLEQGARFVSRLLSAVAGPELDARLFDWALLQLETLPADRLTAIRTACEETPQQAEAVTAYPLDSARRQRLEETLGRLLGMPAACRFGEDAALLAGLRVTLGPWVFDANLQEELRGFAESAHESG